MVTPVAAEDLPMGSLSIWHWIIVIVVVLLLFGGRGKISELMGDVAQGIKAFKKGMSEDDKAGGGQARAGQDHRSPAGATPKTGSRARALEDRGAAASRATRRQRFACA